MVEFTPKEYDKLDSYLRACGHDRDGCRVRWEDGLVFGVYRPRPEWIGISNHCFGMIKLITPCVVHELTHRLQYKRSGSRVAYYLGLTLFRIWWEREAVAAEREAERLLGIDLGD